MNQISLNGIRENFYATVSNSGKQLGKVVSVIKENPNAVVAAIVALAAAVLVLLKCCKAYASLKNQIQQQKNEISDLKLTIIIRQEYSDNLKADFNKDFSAAEENLNSLRKDVKALKGVILEKNAKINGLETENYNLDLENLNLLRENVELLEAQKSAS